MDGINAFNQYVEISILKDLEYLQYQLSGQTKIYVQPITQGDYYAASTCFNYEGALQRKAEAFLEELSVRPIKSCNSGSLHKCDCFIGVWSCSGYSTLCSI